MAEDAAGAEGLALIVAWLCRIQRADADQLRGMDEAVAADVDADVVYALGLVIGRRSAEEEQVAGLEGVELHRNSGAHLLRSVPRQQDAVHEVGAQDEAAAVRFLDGGAAPHVRNAEKAHGCLHDALPVGKA